MSEKLSFEEKLINLKLELAILHILDIPNAEVEAKRIYAELDALQLNKSKRPTLTLIKGGLE